ncbi:MAG: hypothetical protein JNL80_04130 [Phycisphaerae bacterium]|jgi:sugar lactone lactonase YvrE|nr:hypothetical protein [Phycisphaerae bacterium]
MPLPAHSTVASFLMGTAAAAIQPCLHAEVMQVYWTVPMGHSILRVNADGTGVGTIQISPTGDPTAVAFDEANGSMYWLAANINGLDRIYMASIDGGSIASVTTIATALHGLGSDIELDLDAGKIYWCVWSGQSPAGGAIYRCNLDGSGEETIVTGLDRPTRMVLDPANDTVYWTDSGNWLIQRASTLGTNLGVTTIIGNPVSPEGLAIDFTTQFVYWTEFNTGSIKRASLGGNGVDIEVLVSESDGAGPPRDLGVDFEAGAMYWTDPVHSKIRTSNIAGGSISSLASPASLCVGIALRFAPQPPACDADFDRSGEVDGADLALLLGSWGVRGASAWDLTGDGMVDAADLASLLGAWGGCTG